MLVLSRKIGEKIVIDERITITITRVAGGRVSVGIEAPHGMRIVRGELKPLPSATENLDNPEKNLAAAELALDRLQALVQSESRPADIHPLPGSTARLDMPGSSV